MDDVISSFTKRYERTREEELSLEDYLADCKRNPLAYATAAERMLKAIGEPQRGHSYFIVRGEILGFMKDEQLRKHLPRMFSLIKNESWGLEDDQIPS